MTSFKDQIAVVTGASSGVGKAIALALAAGGATLCVVGRKPGALEAVASVAGATSPRVLTYQTDLGLDTEIETLVTRLIQDVGRVDILVHSAGVISLGGADAAPLSDLDWQYTINVRAPYALTQAVLPLLRPHGGQIVFINSSAGLHAAPGVAQYAATKHALKAVADSLRDELNGDAVRVLSIFLGRTASPMQAAVHAAEGEPYHPERLIHPEDVAAVVMTPLSLPRTAEVTEISIRPLMKPQVF